MRQTSSRVKCLISKVQKEQNNCCRMLKRRGQPVDAPSDLLASGLRVFFNYFFLLLHIFSLTERKIKQIWNISALSALKQKCGTL